jgi:hypothetical protein
MGKGEIDGRYIVDTDASETRHEVELHIYDEIPADDLDDVKSAAAVGQSAFDTEMEGVFSWYSGQPAAFKARLRASINAR